MKVPAAVQQWNGRFRGQLHTYHADRGFGFISCFGLPSEVFVHSRSFFFTPPRDLGPGAMIEFDLDCRHGRPRAVNVRLLTGDSDTAPPQSHRDAVAPQRDVAANPRDAVTSNDPVAPPDVAPAQRRVRGRLLSFQPEGYGFVACDGLGDVHVAAQAFAGPLPGNVPPGSDGPEISFDLVEDERTGRRRALHARLVPAPELPVVADTPASVADIPTEVLVEELLRRLSNSEVLVREYFASLGGGHFQDSNAIMGG